MDWWWCVSLAVFMQVCLVEGAVEPVYCSDQTFGGVNSPHVGYGLPCATYPWTITSSSGTINVNPAITSFKRTQHACTTQTVGSGATQRKGPWCLISGTTCTDNVNDKTTCGWAYCPAMTRSGRRCVWGAVYNNAKIYSCQKNPLVTTSLFFCPLSLAYSLTNIAECYAQDPVTTLGLPMGACPFGCTSGNCGPAQTCTSPGKGGANCVFPFKFEGQIHSQCIKWGKSVNFWCGTNADVDANSNQWQECNPEGYSTTAVTTVAAPSNAAPPAGNAYVTAFIRGLPLGTAGTIGSTCDPTWKYKTLTLTGCVTGIDPRGPICGIDKKDVVLGTVTTFGFCPLPDIKCTPATDWKPYSCDVQVENTPPGLTGVTPAQATAKQCVFPFTFNGVTYRYCTTAIIETTPKVNMPPWCGVQAAITTNTPAAGQWSYCKMTTAQCAPGQGCQRITTGNVPCVFPFTYDQTSSSPAVPGQTSHNCITHDHPTNTANPAWCGITSAKAVSTVPSTFGDCQANEVCPADPISIGQTPSCPVLTWISLPSQGASKPGTCKFPFKYNNKIYNSCTKVDASGYWCSHTFDYDQDTDWGDCLIPTYGGNGLGQYCHFPFTYTAPNGNAQQYFDCTTVALPDNANAGKAWCSTTQLFDKDKKWGWCATQFCLSDTEKTPKCTVKALNAGVALECKASFVYPAAGQPGSKTRSPCIVDGAIVPWCEVTDATKNTGNCIRPTHGGTGGESHCYFPFYMGGTAYYTCIKTLDKPEGAWCGTTSQYDNDKKWGYCAMDWCPVQTATTPNCTIKTTGGNGGGADCKFPFTYQGSTYTACSTQNYPIQHTNLEAVPWCCITDNCDGTNPVFGHCTQPTTGGTGLDAPCIFPFLAKVTQTVSGVTSQVDKYFHQCVNGTTDIVGITFTDLPANATWCATTANLATDGKWGICKTDWCETPKITKPPCDILTTDGDKCFFPFTVAGKQYGSCTMENYPGTVGDGEGPVYWCSRQATFVSASSSRWGKCQMPTTGGNSGDKPCVFPFFRSPNWHYDCIKTTAEPNGWCSTTRNYGLYNKYGICSPNFCRPEPKKTPWCVVPTQEIGKPDCQFPSQLSADPNNQAYSCMTSNHPAMSNINSPWCPTTLNFYANRNQWGSCVVPTYGGNAGMESKCILPYRKGGAWKYGCEVDITLHPTLPVCSLTDNYDRDRRWGICSADYCPTPKTAKPMCTVATSVAGRNCVFPFIYQFRQYNTCITLPYPNNSPDKPAPWCALTANYDSDVNKLWGRCTIPTLYGTGNGAPCKIPFSYAGQTYYDCIGPNPVSTSKWCSTTDLFATSYGLCGVNFCPPQSQTPPSCKVKTVQRGINTASRPGQDCTFPFTYKGKQYYTCVTEQYPISGAAVYAWCSYISVLPDNAAANSWGHCIVPTKNKTACAFPFTYLGKTYTQCSSDIVPGRRMCSIIASAVSLSNLDSCEDNYCKVNKTSCPQSYTKTVDGQNCTFPFTYNGVTYHECTMTGHPQLWCGIASLVPVGSNLWRNCADRVCITTTAAPPSTTAAGGCIMQTQEGLPCAFPFFYRDLRGLEQTANECIRLYQNEAFWCSSKRNYSDSGRKLTCAGYVCPTTTSLTSATTASPTACYTQTSDGLSNCSFPFTYQGAVYNNCTTVGHTVLWCPIVPNYREGTGQPWKECGRTICGTGIRTNCADGINFDLVNNTNSLGGSMLPARYTQQECQNACLMNSQCQAVDYMTPLQRCSLHSGTAYQTNVRAMAGNEQWRRKSCATVIGGVTIMTPTTAQSTTPTTPPSFYRDSYDCTKGASYTFDIKSNNHGFGGLEQTSVMSSEHCRYICMQNGNCVAVDWALRRACFIFTSTAFTTASLNSVDHYTKTPCPNGVTCAYDLEIGAGYDNGNLDGSQRNQLACEKVCSNLRTCYGYDFDTRDSSCWLHTASSVRYLQVGVNSYRKIPSTTCPTPT